MAKNGNGLIIGLCGRSGAGKTTVCSEFEKYGIMSIDTDRVYRRLTRPEEKGIPSALVRILADNFGEDVITPEGELNRRALAAKVFGEGNEERLALLNRLTHKAILDKTDEMIVEFFKSGAKGVIVDAPALFESGFHKKCHLIVCVTAPEDSLMRRIMKRDSLSAEEALRRLSSQISERELRLRSDYVIETVDGVAPNDAVAAVAKKILNR